MGIHKQRIRACFNRAKLTYDQHCQLQFHTGCQLLNKIEEHHIAGKNILDIGCGTGNMTAMLSQKNPQLLIGLDFANELLQSAKQKLKQSSIFYCADFDNIPSVDDQFNLVFSNMALQWSVNFFKTMSEITRIINNGGILAFSLPIEGTFSRVKKILSELTDRNYLNDFVSPLDIHDIIRQSGYALISADTEYYHQKFVNLMAAFQSIKKVGALINNRLEPLAKSVYRKTFSKEIQLDYHIGHFIAKKV